MTNNFKKFSVISERNDLGVAAEALAFITRQKTSILRRKLTQSYVFLNVIKSLQELATLGRSVGLQPCITKI